MKINEEINQYMEQIDKLGFEKILNLNSKQTASILGVSASSIKNEYDWLIGTSFDRENIYQKSFQHIASRKKEYKL